MSTVSRSTGSWTRPSTSRVTTRGWPTVISKPSRRISSTSTASWSSPRPCTSQASGRSVGSTRIETLPTSSRSSRSLTRRAVTLAPLTRPAIGLVDGDEGQGPRVVGVRERLADGDLGDAGHGDDVARSRRLRRSAFERVGHEQLGDLDLLDRAVTAAPGDLLALADRAVVHAQQ